MMYELSNLEHTENLSNIYRIVAQARFPTAITGAGISIASGLPTINEKISGIQLNNFFKQSLWKTTPEKFFYLYRQIQSHWRNAKINPAHIALAELGAYVITQNIDGLHRDAQTRNLIELHGNLRELHCPVCKIIFNLNLLKLKLIPHCPNCCAILKPGITFEGEEVRHIALAVDWIGRADVLFIVGTQLDMVPAFSLVQIARKTKANLIWINKNAELILPSIIKYSTHYAKLL